MEMALEVDRRQPVAGRPAVDAMRSLRLPLPTELTSAAAAREFVRIALEGSDEGIIEVIAVLTSELVTNAVLHAGPPIQLELSWSTGRVRVAVTDGGADRPVARSPELEETSGRGLMIVSALAEGWGVEPVPAGKRVWAEVVAGAGSGLGDETSSRHAYG